MRKCVKISKLRMLRLSKGFSQQHVACKLKITRQYLSLIELGERPITEKVLPRIMKFYKVKNKRELIG